MTTPTPQQNDGSYFDSLVPRVTRADLEREMAKVVIPPKTPQRMRELADQHEERAQWTAGGESGRKWFRDTAAALRTAADQLEAVQTWADHADPVYADLSGLYAILTADAAPRKASVVDAILEASRLQLAVEESADTAPQEKMKHD